MKQFFFLLLMIGLSHLTVAQTSTQAPVKAYTLQEAIDFATENNPNLKSVKLGIKAAEYKVGETLAIGLPQISATADLGNNFVIPTSFLPAQVFGGAPGEFVGVKFGTQYVGRATFNVDQ